MNRRPYLLGPAEDADLVGMRLYGKGPFHRENKPASRIAKKSHFVIRSGDVIYNKLFAWKGAFGVVPSELDGMFVSDKFPTYDLDEVQVHKPFLEWYFRCPKLWDEARARSKGSAALSKLTLNPPQFLDLPLPLPSPDEQQHVVDRLDNLSRCLEQVRKSRILESRMLLGRRVGTGQEGRWLMLSALQAFQRDFLGKLSLLGTKLAAPLRHGPSFAVSALGEGVAVIMPSATTGFGFNPEMVAFATTDLELRQDDFLMHGDILFPRGNKPDQVGNCGVYGGDPVRATYANLFMRIRVDPQVLLPDFLHYWLMTPVVREHVVAHTKGTSPSVQKINGTGVKSIPVPDNVPIPVQARWVAHLDRLGKLTARLEREIIAALHEMDAAGTALVNAAFSGKLPMRGPAIPTCGPAGIQAPGTEGRQPS
jgi:type I restriction enzyme S subunit